MKKTNNKNVESSNIKMLLFPLIIVVILIVAVVGITYAYFSATASNNTGVKGNTAGVDLDLKVNRISTSASGNLIPVDSDITSLTTAAKGYGNTGNTFNANLSCIDKNGYSSCQVYQIDVTNTSDVTLNLTGGVTSLSGTKTPNLACAVMASSTSVTSNSTCVGNSTIASNVRFSANETKTYYIMVYINNLSNPQTDSGSFNGTVEFSALGGKVTATFSS